MGFEVIYTSERWVKSLDEDHGMVLATSMMV
jgi:hypothetical protein